MRPLPPEGCHRRSPPSHHFPRAMGRPARPDPRRRSIVLGKSAATDVSPLLRLSTRTILRMIERKDQACRMYRRRNRPSPGYIDLAIGQEEAMRAWRVRHSWTTGIILPQNDTPPFIHAYLSRQSNTSIPTSKYPASLTIRQAQPTSSQTLYSDTL